MRKHHAISSAPLSVGSPDPKPEIDYTPKAYTLGETLRYGSKFLAVAGIVLLLFWLIETYLY